MEPRLLKTEEVAEILQVSRSFAYQLMKRGEIPSVRIGNAVRVRPEDLQRYISEKALQVPVAPSFKGQAS
ncbi:MAG: helix-turn-helix domain-containing protein [Anaerolineales bacterium]|jgi:excisionase family DNA binding protein